MKQSTFDISLEEYTDKGMSLARYMSKLNGKSMNKVFAIADSLTKVSNNNGINYKQHNWNKQSDNENLAVGIDCSRAIWFAFTRANVQYNSSNKYLSTVDMINEKSKMSDSFNLCSTNEEFKPGDVLVYRNKKKGEGHTVLVVDYNNKIAWGSHYWDGTKTEFKNDVGVEYQKIGKNRSWANWDKSDMKLVACWRHRKFIVENLE